ncbi:hypothetical protein V8E55_005983 [Tylopilus felleus]
MHANGIPLDTATIVSTVLEGIPHGLSLLMFIGTIWALMYGRAHCGVNISRMALTGPQHMVIDIIRTYEGLVVCRDSPEFHGPIGFFSDIYRCYVVWQLWWFTVFPILLSASVAVTGVGTFFGPSTGPWITAFLAATLFTNLISTSLLAFRIWKIGRCVKRTSSHSSVLRPVLRIVLDAGVLYSVSLLAALLCFVSKTRGRYIMPIISITFYMVIIWITICKSSSQGAISTR